MRHIAFMRYCFFFALLLLSGRMVAQIENVRVSFRLNSGIGFNNKPDVMFGVPFALSGDMSGLFADKWRFAIDFGALGFRDSRYPDDVTGWVFGSYIRYKHSYYGLLVGYSLLSPDQPQKLYVSIGVDDLKVAEPVAKRSQSSFSGKAFDYIDNKYLSVPIQVDYSVLLVKERQARLVLSGRWNVNAYHTFPMISMGINLPMYPLPDSHKSQQKAR